MAGKRIRNPDRPGDSNRGDPATVSGTSIVGADAVGSVDDNGSGYIDPASVGDPASGTDSNGDGSGSGNGRGRRGRRPGTKNKPKDPSFSVTGVEQLLLSIHMMMAAKFEAPELMLDQPTANRFAQAIGAVQELYPVNVSAKAAAWTNLVITAGAIYGPRIMLIKHRRKMERTQKTTQPDNVVQFNNGVSATT